MNIKIFLLRIVNNRNYQLGIMAVLLVLGAILVWLGVFYSINNQPQIPQPEIAKINTNTNKHIVPKKYYRLTDGVETDKNKTNRFPLAVMIENLASSEVRPQSGLNDAEIVYEVIVEGGITRFLAIYSSETEIKKIGPVRSARNTFLEFVSEYDALYIHAGGSPNALQAIDGLKINDCSGLSSDGRFYWRDQQFFAPHNLFTSSQLLTYALRDKNLLSLNSNFTSWQFKNDEDENSKIENSKLINNIEIDFSEPNYAVKWEYNPKKNNYLRLNGGQKHTDALTGKQLTAKNVIIEIVPPATSIDDEGRVDFSVTGSGPAIIFQDGKKISGTWEKSSRTERTLYFNESHKEIEFNRGKIWIEILPADRSYTTS
ncbi:MAG: DUF3048 domain-containing protein [Patescibacteria group bacterium]